MYHCVAGANLTCLRLIDKVCTPSYKGPMNDKCEGGSV